MSTSKELANWRAHVDELTSQLAHTTASHAALTDEHQEKQRLGESKVLELLAEKEHLKGLVERQAHPEAALR